MFKKIEVFSQAELDAIPQDFHGRILIKFGTWNNRAILKRKLENAVVEARENSSVLARGNSSVEAWGNSSVEAWENSSVVAWENSSVEAWENSSVLARENSSVLARGNSSVLARGNSSVEAWENSSVEAWENSSVEARGNSSVEAWGNTQVVAASERAQVRVSGNARIVYNPKTPEEYAEHCGLECRDGVMVLYKAVHKRDGSYYSDKDPAFEYKIGETVVPKYPMDANPKEDCGSGIHAAHKAWCVDYGRKWGDLAILEVEMLMASMVVPVNGSGKVRADRATVIREVPLEECGLLGKMLAKRRGGA